MRQTLFRTAQNRIYKFLFEFQNGQDEGLTKEGVQTNVEDLLNDLITLVQDKERLLNEEQVTKLYPFRREYLRDKRCAGEGPAYHKFGRSRNSKVFYRINDIEAWIDENKRSDPYVAKLANQR